MFLFVYTDLSFFSVNTDKILVMIFFFELLFYIIFCVTERLIKIFFVILQFFSYLHVITCSRPISRRSISNIPSTRGQIICHELLIFWETLHHYASNRSNMINFLIKDNYLFWTISVVLKNLGWLQFWNSGWKKKMYQVSSTQTSPKTGQAFLQDQTWRDEQTEHWKWMIRNDACIINW